MANNHLAIYLNDHLAGATGALELLAHLQEAHADTPLGDALTQLHTEIEAERQELEHLIDRLDINVSSSRKIGAWLAEKLAQLKLQIDEKADGSMRVFEGLEALALGIQGKRGLWQVLASVSRAAPELGGIDYHQLVRRSEDQYRRVEALRLQSAWEAFEIAD